MGATFSNPADQAKATGDSYVKLLLDTLGDRDPIAVQQATLSALEKAIRGLDAPALRRAEKPGKWSVVEVLQHLADSELVGGYRMRMILSHPTPDIQGFDQDLWARELSYADRRAEDALEEFRVLRRANLALLRSLRPDQLERYGNHTERGRESIARMMKLYAAHDLVHLKQIERIKTVLR